MGCSLSRRSECSTFQGVRVVHINGYVKDYPGPVAVGDVTGKPPQLACFSPAQLLSFAGPRPLPLDDTLEPGRLYFLLPHSVFRSDTSPVDLATLVTRLTALARNAADPKLCDGAVKVTASPRHGDVASAGRDPEAESLGGRMPSRARSWKPMLDTIEEWSVGRSTRSSSSRSGSSRRPPHRG